MPTARSRCSREKVRRVESAGCAVHNLLERVTWSTARGRATAWVIATNVYVQDRAGLAPGGASRQPGQRSSRRRDRDAVARCIDHAAPMQHYRAPRWLPGGHAADHLAGVVLPGAAAHQPASARTLDHAGWRLHRCRFQSTPPAATAPAAGAVPRPGRLVTQPLRPGLCAPRRAARLGLCGAALPRLLGRTEPGTARLPLGRLRGDRLDPGAPARARRRAAAGGRRLARWQRAAALGRGGRHQRGSDDRRGGSGLLADRPGRRRPCDRQWLQPPHLLTHVPAHDEAACAGQVGPAPGLVRPRSIARRA